MAQSLGYVFVTTGRSCCCQAADAIPISDNTIQRRISDRAADVKEQVLDAIPESPFFSIQLDGSTDVANCAQLMVYVRFIKELDVQEEFLFCHPLPARTTATEIFKALNDFIQENHIDWSRCCGICTDGARAMTGRHSGLVKQVQAVAPPAVWSHCIIRSQALATKRMPKELRAVLDEAVKMVNLIKSRAMNARLFSILCNEMGAHFHQLLLHSEVRWLSRGKSSLTRLCDLHEEVLMFLAEINSPLVKHIEDTKWVAMLAYLSDIVDRINTLNTSLQGKECHVFLAHDQGLREQFGDYFEEESLANQWVRNPFSFPVTPRDGLTMQEEEALVQLNSNMDLKQKMREVSLAQFWLSVETEFPHLTNKAVKVFIPFTSTYLCECGFSALTMIKSKHSSRLRVEDDLRLFLSTVHPRINRLCASKTQAHCSH
ncbi:zinc finger BED domain-containing protein 5-like [Cololabis saira]|uniref:zinc finger BED domain-containing protein 5-like n=1 Tax=Cololabis saira TaxID=129043 RepID=UPI002AD4802E|nr:zinc finger BED domain-containing protein 5-like [Cololabis saira]